MGIATEEIVATKAVDDDVAVESEKINNQAKQTYIEIKDLPAKRGYCFVKRVSDIVLSTLALIVLLIPMAIIALIIWIDDPKGSPVFLQKRCGKDGKEFKLFKFRTMCVDAEGKLEELLKQNEMQGPAFKISRDPRITRVGKYIRRGGVDELPQLINIIKGDMSIVGPRPCLPREYEQYNDYQKQRLLVTPGLTCYWQIQPDRNKITFDDWMILDIKYMKERSYLTDWKIIFQTLRAVFRADGK